MAEDGPAGYYVGRPMNHDDQKTQPPPPSQAVDEQVNAQVPGYYAGRVQGKKNAAGDQSSAAADQTPKESGFLASCFGCFSGGQTAK
ncbi:hypothetical protein HU200_000649 [Digitaria exilis]|uniref:Uncharacterized protein n=1 Tax=Digitaria exilis TaxID=1010633 RepID=A0A835KWL6_9POAL|nr:hypothetical protein HU200_034712 [Digitaria exilis]KAF8781242.1 hypothetical protein HU200_000649 [Digitaria exilis]CAB3489617.1 unnamed protein product [Digitaria exilis]